MTRYYLRLALKSFRRNPGLTAVMICAIALGIGVSVVTITVYHAMSGNPIWWKSDRLYAVTLDSWAPDRPFSANHPDLPPPQLSYRDAKAVIQSDIPERKVAMFKASGVITGGAAQHAPGPVLARVTTSDFFSMFDVPFLYGSGWTPAADRGPENVIVLSKKENEKLFGGVNSVGRTIRWNDRPFRIIGVLDEWFPLPKFYDLTIGAFMPPEDVYLPFGWGEALELLPSGDEECWKIPPMKSYRDFLNSDCLWMQTWVELPNRASRDRMQAYLDAYWTEQHKAGRFERPRNNRLTDVSHWLVDNDVVANDNRMLVGIALAFLAVCVINTIGILLAKFIGRSSLAGVRRALGASRRDVFTQHLVEVTLLCMLGASAGLGLAALGLLGVHALYAQPDPGGYQEIMHFDVASIYWAVTLAIASAILAGLYPAWRVGRVPPAIYLKSQ